MNGRWKCYLSGTLSYYWNWGGPALLGISSPKTLVPTCNWGHFERKKLIFKTLPLSWADTMLTTRSRSFQRGTVSLCRSKGWKVVVRQSLRIIQLSWAWTWAAHVWFNTGQAAECFSYLQLSQLVTLQPFDLQRLKVHLLKDLNLFYWYKLCSKE